MFGFEQQDQRRYPVIGGVVVLSRDAEVIREAAIALEVDKEERRQAKREEQVLRRWEAIVRAALSREKLREKYGH